MRFVSRCLVHMPLCALLLAGGAFASEKDPAFIGLSNIKEKVNKLSLAQYAKGVYMVKVITDNGVIVNKIVKD